MNESLREELLAMQAEDQAARSRSPLARSELDALDRRHTDRLRDIVRDHGYPGKTLVGEDGAFAAWLIAQHSGRDRLFQEEFLSMMEEALLRGEAEPRTYAYLRDRVLLASGEPQVYGTQYQRDGEYLVLCPTENPTELDERRHSVGLRSAAEYLVRALALDEAGKTVPMPNARVICRETSSGLWRATVSSGERTVMMDITWDADRLRCRVFSL